MIVKNEEEFLPQCLESVRKYVDEIVVVDTGSTDRTVEIAQSFGARIYHHPWENNFSKHRNQSIHYATGDWLLILDADEELDPETAPLLKKAVQQTTAAAISIIVRSYLDGGTYFNESISPRLFRNGLGFHYVGFVHNQPVIKGATEMYPVVVWHYGYDLDAETKEKKKRRSLRLLQEQARRFPGDTPTRHHLSMTYFSLGDWENACQEALKTITLVEEKGLTDGGYSWTYYVLTASMMALGRIDEAEEWAQKGLVFYDKSPDLFFLLVDMSFKKRAYAQTLEYGKEFFRLKELLKENPSEFGFIVFETVNREWTVYQSMGYSYLTLNDRENAFQFLKEAVATAPDHKKDELRQEIGTNWMKVKGQDKAIHFLERLPVDNDRYTKGLTALCSAYEQRGFYRKLASLCGDLRKTFPHDFEIPFKEGIALMKLGDLRQAVLSFDEAASLNPGHANSLLNHGLVLETLVEQAGALEKYEAALAIEPDSPVANLNAGLFHFKSRAYAEATAPLAIASAHFPDNVYLSLACARCYVATGDLETMIGVCERILRLLDLPSDLLIQSLSQVAELFVGIGKRLLTEKKFDSFSIALDLAHTLGLDTTESLKELCTLAFRRNLYTQGIGILETALAVDPTDAELAEMLGVYVGELERQSPSSNPDREGAAGAAAGHTSVA